MIVVLRFKGGRIHKARWTTAPVKVAQAKTPGLVPHDAAFLFDPLDCIRPASAAYSAEGGLAILYGQLAPEGSVLKTAGISDGFKQTCGPDFVFEGPCVIFESQEEAL